MSTSERNCFKRLLLAHAEAVLLVDDHQAEALEDHVLLQQTVGADDDVDLALREELQGLGLLLGRLEARQLGELDRPVGEAVGEGLVVLLGEQGGRAQHHHLLAVGHRDEGGAQRDLGLAEADVAAHQAVHRAAGFHVGHHRVDGGLLVGRGLEAEGLGEGFEVMLLEVEAVAGAGGALGIEREQFGGGVAHLHRGFLLGLLPLAGAEAVQVDRLGVGAGVAGDHVQLRHRHIELVAAVVLQMQELGVALAEVHVEETEVAADAVRDVHHRVADLELGKVAQPAFHGGGLARVAAHAAARGGGVELGLGQHREPCSR
jgi:hypothetical protein